VLPCVGTYSNANTKNFAYHPPHIFRIETFAQALHPMTEGLMKVFIRNLVKTSHPTWQYFAFTVMGNYASFFHLILFVTTGIHVVTSFTEPYNQSCFLKPAGMVSNP
jgi:hypothetical protein